MKPVEAGTAFTPANGIDLDKILSHQEIRVVGAVNTARYRRRCRPSTDSMPKSGSIPSPTLLYADRPSAQEWAHERCQELDAGRIETLLSVLATEASHHEEGKAART